VPNRDNQNFIHADLSAVEKHAWSLLLGDTFKTLSLATVSLDNMPEVRHLILRGCDARRRELYLWTDFRSPKIESINANSSVAISGFDLSKSVQICCKGQACIFNQDETTRAAWRSATNYNKLAYARLAPGQQISERSDASQYSNNLDSGYENFVVLTIRIGELDYLNLDHCGNTRAAFHYDNEGTLAKSTWLA